MMIRFAGAVIVTISLLGTALASTPSRELHRPLGEIPQGSLIWSADGYRIGRAYAVSRREYHQPIGIDVVRRGRLFFVPAGSVQRTAAHRFVSSLAIGSIIPSR